MVYKEKLLRGLIPVSEEIVVPPKIEVVCGVLIPLGVRDNSTEVDIVMTKRTSKVLTHKGQVSFPGGVREKEDKTILQTALRESEEEVGLEASKVQVLGRLAAVTTHTTNLLIYPFVGLVRLPYEFRISTDEVDKILLVPLEKIVKEGLPPVTVEIEGFQINSVGFTFENELIWGASARMLEELRKTLLT